MRLVFFLVIATILSGTFVQENPTTTTTSTPTTTKAYVDFDSDWMITNFAKTRDYGQCQGDRKFIELNCIRTWGFRKD